MMGNSRKLELGRRNAWIGGVCSGVADYLNIDILIVRIVCAIGMLTWWPTIIAYIACYISLSGKKPSIKEFGSNFANTRIARHFKNVDYRKCIYKSTRDKKIAGVCAGIARYFEVSPFMVRAVALGSLFFGPMAFIAYIAGAVIMDRDPDENLDYQREGHEQKQKREHREHSRDPKRDIRECESRFSSLETKLRRLEATITSKKFKLHSEMKNL